MSDIPFIRKVKNQETLSKDDIIRLTNYRDNLVKFMEQQPAYENSRLQYHRQQNQSLFLNEIISQTKFLKDNEVLTLIG